jgi:hypothetical protein
VHEVDQVGVEELADRGGASADPDVAAIRGLLGQVQHLVGRRVDEVEAGPVGELDRAALVMGHDEHRCPERWFVAPPAAPSVVGPLAGLRPELAPSHDFGADALTPRAEESTIQRDGVVDLVDPVNDAAVEPTEELPGTADRGVERHFLAGRVSVQGDEQVVDTGAGHGDSSK